MNLYEIRRSSNTPLKTLRKLDALGVLKIDREDNEALAMSKLLFQMRGNKTLTVPLLMRILDAPSLIEEIAQESENYGARAVEQLTALGDPRTSPAPKEVTAQIQAAGKGDINAGRIIAAWLKEVLPVEPVPYHWIAVRLLLPLTGFLRKQYAPLLMLVMLNVRNQPEFQGYWQAEKNGTRNTIKYFKNSLDL